MSRTVRGFRFAGVPSGIKPGGALDLGLIVVDSPASAAGVFTQNRVRAAPVLISERRLRGGSCKAILVNSGNANACTGKEGHDAALFLTRRLAALLDTPAKLVVPASTGVIGVQLPLETVNSAIPALVSELSPHGAGVFSRAILTTDREPKVAEAQLTIGRTKCQVLGIAKGAGMIHPDMATTLAFVQTDASVAPAVLQAALSRATERTFNRASVDGDTSTNDSIYALASGLSSRQVERRGVTARKFDAALVEVLEALIKMIVADGEGAQHLVRIDVEGTRTNSDAVQIARTIASSQLVKTAIHGCDPNWGRILAAAGRSGARFNPDHTSIKVGKVLIYRDGRPTMTAKTEAKAAQVMQQAEYAIAVQVGKGKGFGHYWTCDLGHEYVRINADYRT